MISWWELSKTEHLTYIELVQRSTPCGSEYGDWILRSKPNWRQLPPLTNSDCKSYKPSKRSNSGKLRLLPVWNYLMFMEGLFHLWVWLAEPSGYQKNNKGQYFMKIGKITLSMGLRSVEALRLWYEHCECWILRDRLEAEWMFALQSQP